MVQSGGPELDKLERGLRQILRVRRRTDLIVDDLHGPFGLGPPEEAFQEAVPIRAEQPARTDDADVVGVGLKARRLLPHREIGSALSSSV